jgi:DNA-binding CsgD family transcriptional regulator
LATGQVDRDVADPLHDVLPGVLHIAPASAWSSARIRHDDLSDFSYVGSGLNRNVLAKEYRLQRTVSSSGRRIAALRQAVPGYTFGICMIVNDGHEDRAIVMLLRDASLAPFSSAEISLLTLALAAQSERLAALRVRPLSERNGGSTVHYPFPGLGPSHEAAFYILDADFTIVLSWQPEDSRRTSALYEAAPTLERLPPILEESVRTLTAGWTRDSIKEPGIAQPVPSLVLRTQPLKGQSGQFVAVHVERFVPSNAVADSAIRYRFTPREVEVLAELLDGLQLDEIARHLFISQSTVQDHVRNLLEKSSSRNRTEMIARIFGWKSAANGRENA